MKLLKFYTDYCSQCKLQSDILKDYNEIEIEDIDCEENEELVYKYNIRKLPTLVFVDNNMEALTMVTGVTQLDVIEGIVNTLNSNNHFDM